MLELRNVTWSLPGGEVIIDDLTLSIPEGRLSVVTGPNGGGKTTWQADRRAGQAHFRADPAGRSGHHGIGCHPARPSGHQLWFPDAGALQGPDRPGPAGDGAGRALSCEEMCELTGKVGLCTMDYIDRDVDASLSGGEIKRVEIASVLARGTQVSIFDEPEAGIDLWSFNGLVDVFSALKQRGMTMVIISHQQRLLDIADEIIVISSGQLRVQGARDRVMPGLLAGEIAGHCPAGRKVGA